MTIVFIPLTQGKTTIIDFEDFDKVRGYKWCILAGTRTSYAKRAVCINGRTKTILMHREILGLTSLNQFVDHIDGNGLNNQRENLRIASKRENGWNQTHKMKACSSKFKGVCWHKTAKKWESYINVHRHKINLGLFNSENEAAEAYITAAKTYFGEFAHMAQD